MLKDLSKINQVLYYLTSMSLSIILFLLKIFYDNFEKNDLSHKQILLIVILIILVMYILSRILYKSLIKKYNLKKYPSQEEYNEENFNKENISEINGQPVSFLISNVTTLYVISAFPIPSILAFTLIHVLLFLMMIKGENLQPNPFLYIYGVDIYKTKNNDFLINFNSKKTEHNEILKANNNKNTRTYIIGNLDER